MNIQKLLYQNIFWRGLFFVSGFVLNVLVARVYSAEITGWIYYLFTLFSFFTLIGSFSLEAAIIYFGSKGEIPLRSLAGFSWKWTALVGAMIIAVYTIALITGTEPDLQKFYFALFFICGNVLITFMSAIFYARKNYLTSNAVAISVNLLLITLLFVLDKHAFIPVYFGSFLFLGILLSCIVLYQIRGKRNDDTYFKKLFRYSLLAFASNLVFFLLYKIDYWFVNRYTNAQDLGNYIQVSKVVQIFFILPSILAQALFPLFSGNHIQRVQNYLQLLSRTIFFLYLIVCGIVALVGKWLFPAVYGASFTGMYLPFLLLIPGILSLSTLYSLTAWFSGNNMVRVNLMGCLFATVIIIAGDALFIPRFGIEAAALISSIGYIAYHAYVLHAFNRIHNTGFAPFFLFRLADIQSLKSLLLKKHNDS